MKIIRIYVLTIIQISGNLSASIRDWQSPRRNRETEKTETKNMKTTKLTVKEITELQPTRVAMVRGHRTVVGGIAITGEYDAEAVSRAVATIFGDDCAVWECEPDAGDECLHVVVYHKL